jgi:hypothetical protein
MNCAAYVLQEIGGQESQGGARRGTILTMVDGRQKLMLTDIELDEALADLTGRRLIEQDGEVYRLSSEFRGRVPRLPSGCISMVRADWERLAEELGFGDAAT